MKNVKKIAVLTAMFGVFISNLPAQAAMDKEKPKLESVVLNSTQAVANKDLKITALASDKGGSGINSATVTYEKPLTKKTQKVILYKVSDKKLQGVLPITSSYEKGTWTVLSIAIRDGANNVRTYYNKYGSMNWTKENLQDFRSMNFNYGSAPIKLPVVTAQAINNYSKMITGTATENSKVYATINGKVVGTATALSGKYNIVIAPQSANTKVVIYSMKNNVKSKLVTLTVSKKVVEKNTAVKTNLNYFDDSVVAKIKSGQMTMIDGMKLDDYASNYNNKYYNDDLMGRDTARGYVSNGIGLKSRQYESVVGVSDFIDNPIIKPKITRIVHNIAYGDTAKYERKYLLQKYGTPSKENTWHVSDFNDYIVDFYDNVTFVYVKYSYEDKYELHNVIFLGQEYKNNYAKWKLYLQSLGIYIYGMDLHTVLQEDWDNVGLKPYEYH